MQNKISPSMMCADPVVLSDTLMVFEENKIEYLHIDIMDGEFVPNYTLGPDYCRFVRNACDIPLDIHLMVMRPEDKLAFFDIVHKTSSYLLTEMELIDLLILLHNSTPYQQFSLRQMTKDISLNLYMQLKQ